MRKPTSSVRLSWRIGVPMYESDAAFAELAEFLVQHRQVVDEVALFETITHHLYFPLAVFEQRAETMRKRLRALKATGIASAGINVLCTIGHLNEGWDYMPPLPFQAMVGHDGAVSKSCACPNTAEFRAYIAAKYQLMAHARPDFIWVDDDIRMHHHGVGWGCFCPTCLERFTESTGRKWTRPALVTALNDPANRRLREAWVDQNITSLESLMADVKVAIHQVSPRIATGLMTAGPGWTTYSGQALGRWCTALGAVKARPGGGFYSDTSPLDMVHKAMEIGRQVAALPPTVTDCQYEQENFPCTVLGKSVATIISECTLAFGVGVNGIAFNALNNLAERQPLMAQVAVARPFWELLNAHARGLPTAGVWPAWSPRLVARRQVRPGEDWFGWHRGYDINLSRGLLELGLPLAAAPAGTGTVLTGRLADAFSDDELRETLSGGVLLDTAALDALTERGLGDLTGVRVCRRVDNGVREKLTDDPLNGAFAGTDRYACIEFWGDARGLADILEPLAPEVRVLARLETYLGEVYGPCMTAFENALGGRVVVTGYAPWMFIGTTAKREQLLNVADWLSHDQLPLRIEETVKLIPFLRLAPDRRRGAAVLLNASFDVLPRVTLHFRTPPGPVRLAAPGRPAKALRAVAEAGGWRTTLRQVPPWTAVAVLFGE